LTYLLIVPLLPPPFTYTMDRFDPGPRAKVLATILFHSTCAISVTLVSKSALNGIDAPVVLLAFQTTVQVVLLTAVGMMMGWVKLWRPLAVSHTLPVSMDDCAVVCSGVAKWNIN